jgi:hypothetical protein
VTGRRVAPVDLAIVLTVAIAVGTALVLVTS